MGITGLYDFLRETCPSAITKIEDVSQLIEFFKQKPNASVDTAIFLYTMAYQNHAVRKIHGDLVVLPSLDEKMAQLYNRLITIGCKPIFVLDSEPHPLKMSHIKVKRDERKSKAKGHIQKLESQLQLLKRIDEKQKADVYNANDPMWVSECIKSTISEVSEPSFVSSQNSFGIKSMISSKFDTQIDHNPLDAEDDDETDIEEDEPMTDANDWTPFIPQKPSLETVIQEKKKEIESKKSQLIHITREDHLSLGDYMNKMGIPHRMSPRHWDAEKYCCYLCHQTKMCDVVISSDGDALAFGAPYLIVHLFSKRYKTEIYDLKKILLALGLTMDMFQQMCVMIGTDFSAGIKGIGPKKAYQFIKKYKTIDKFLESGDALTYWKFIKEGKHNWKGALEVFQNFTLPIISE